MSQNSSHQRPPPRRIRRLMVANRGEIATRIISAARELGIETLAIYTSDDESHAIGASKAVQISSPSSYLNIDELLHIVKEYRVDAIHPGYGFLSESDEFSKRMWYEANAAVVGPGWDILAQVGDKAQARRLANDCRVPVLPGLETATDDAQTIIDFAMNATLPIMIKAVDGGGGRGIRLVRDKADISNAVTRAMRESPSGQVIVEKAAADGFHHIEVQIIGDGNGGVRHLWERECSIQRRYQKVIEIAPALFEDRKIIARVIDDAIKIAKQVSYFSLGTFEFLVNPTTDEHYFLEVNPRLQVEHTITEQVTLTDVVQCQLLLSQGASFDEIGLLDKGLPAPPYGLHSIQLRVTAEDVLRNWTLSTGEITSFRLPSGNGVRVDTCLGHQDSLAVPADFDSLLAKVIVTSTSWAGVVEKAKRALDDMYISGVATNLDMLRVIVADSDFISGACDIQWLDKHYRKLVDSISPSQQQSVDAETEGTNSHPGAGTDKSDTHIIIPFSGKLVEVAVDVGDVVGEDDVICVVQQMKMELEVRSHRAGRISWVMEDEDGSMVSEGAVAAVIEPVDRPKL